jgi:serine/threonine protein phosphatase PrpC
MELVLAANFAAVTDRGLRHPRNEDDVALTVDNVGGKPVYVMVVCDGVSSSQIPDTASATAAHAAEKALLAAAQSEAPDFKVATVEAILAAQHAVCALPFRKEGPKDPPATTIVTALISEGVATIGWVGDSRAYWFNETGGGILTHDHSWVNEVVDAGEMTEEEAMHAPEAHAITQCLGMFGEDDKEDIPTPSVVAFDLRPSCRLLLCTDGLWNYAASTDAIAELMRQEADDPEAVGMCRVLVDYVLAQGARDNVTVALLSV